MTEGKDPTKSIRQKVILLSILGLAVLSSYLLISSYFKSVDASRKLVLLRLHSIAMTLAPQINAKTHLALTSKYRDKDAIKKNEDDPRYLKLHKLLKRAQKMNKLSSEIYTLVKQDNLYRFVVTSGQKPYYFHDYKTAPKEHMDLYEKGGMLGPYRDKHGVWLSAFYPIKDGEGNVIAVIQADQRFEQFQSTARKIFFKDLIVSSAMTVAIALFLFFFIGRISREFTRLLDLNTDISSQLKVANDELKKEHEYALKSLHQLREAQTQLVESEKMASLGRLVAGVAHEINTPLGIGVTAASHLKEKTESFAELFETGKMKKSNLKALITANKESSDIILSNLKRAAELIKNFKQVAVDQTSEQRRKFLGNKYIGELMSSLTPKFKGRNLSISFTFEGEVELNSYPGSLAQVLTNLVANSLLHAYEPTDEGRLHFETGRVGDKFRIEYSDDGKGIAPENVAKIFEPFYTTKRGQGGTGLGLHIVHNIVMQNLGGTIRCESEEGVGTVFIIEIPIVVPEKKATPTKKENKKPRSESFQSLIARTAPAEASSEMTLDATLLGDQLDKSVYELYKSRARDKKMSDTKEDS